MFGGGNYLPDISSSDGQGQDRVLAMLFFTPEQDPLVELWNKQTLTDTGVRLEGSAPLIVAAHGERGWLIGGFQNQLFVYDIETGARLQVREGFVGSDMPSHFNTDGSRLITTDQKGNATLWDTATWEHVVDFESADGPGVIGANFAPSGELVTVDLTGAIVVRDPETLESSGPPMIGPVGLFLLRFTTDGTRLLSTGNDPGSILCDLESRTRIADGLPTVWMWPAPDGSDRGVSADGENILIWNLNTDEWYDIACRAAGRNMTRVEWEEFGPRDAEYQATCPQFPLEGETGS